MFSRKYFILPKVLSSLSLATAPSAGTLPASQHESSNQITTMKKLLIALMLTIFNYSFSQFSKLEIITNDNDTIRNVALKNQNIGNPTKNYKLQNELVYTNIKREVFKLKPSEVKSFKFMYGEELVNYESRDNSIFALVMYSNRLKLLRFQKPAYTPVDIYVVERANGKVSFLEAMGLSRRISLKVITREMSDCPITISKVEKDILKIQGEPGILELIQDYEKNCY